MLKQFYIKQISLVQVQFQCLKTVPFQIIQFSISSQFNCQNYLFQIIQFTISMQFSFI